MTSLFSWRETTYLSPWSIQHFLCGYLWCLSWIWTLNDWLPWLNLMLFVIVALLWELFENQPGNHGWLWRCFGYKDGEYTGDTVMNAITDVVVCSLGWLTVRIVTEYTTSTAALGVLLGLAAFLFLIFLYLHRKALVILQSATVPMPVCNQRPHSICNA